MKRFTLLLVALGAWAVDADAAEEGLRAKALAAAAAPASASGNAPFRGGYDAIPGLLLREEAMQLQPQGVCERHSRDFCYDAAERRVVYRPVRRYMPAFDGLTAESVSLRHDRLVLKYSFR